MIFVLISLLVLVTGWFISAPLWQRASGAASASAASRTPLIVLQEQRDTLLKQLKELEFDHSMGKITPEDYSQSREQVASETSQVLTRLEQLTGKKTSTTPTSKPSTNGHHRPTNLGLEIEVEVLIARARHHLKKASSQAIAQVVAGWTCQNCGRQMGDSDQFCASCGTRREAAAGGVAGRPQPQ